MLRALALSWLLLTSVARADPVQAVQAVLARVESDRALGATTRAQKRLSSALDRRPGAAPLLLRYAELTLSCERAPEPRSALALLRRLARYAALPSDASTVPDAELDRKLSLYAAHAEAALARDEDSVGHLQEGMRRQDPLSARCARAVALQALQRDQLALATEALRIAREAMPQDPDVRAELARLWLARGRSDQALPLLAEQFAGASGSLEARRDLAYALAADGRADEARSLLEPAREACRREPSCALIGARSCLAAGRLDEALRYVEGRLQEDPHDPDALFLLADVHTRAGRIEAARAAYQRVLGARPDSVRAQQALRALEQAPGTER